MQTGTVTTYATTRVTPHRVGGAESLLVQSSNNYKNDQPAKCKKS